MSCGLAHAPATAAGAEAASFATERHQMFEVATVTLHPQEAIGQDPAAQVLLELFDHEVWEGVAGVQHDLVFEGQPVSLHDLVQHALFRLVALVFGLVVGYGLRHRTGKSCNPVAMAANDPRGLAGDFCPDVRRLSGFSGHENVLLVAPGRVRPLVSGDESSCSSWCSAESSFWCEVIDP